MSRVRLGVNDPFQHGNFQKSGKPIQKEAENTPPLRSYIHRLLGKGDKEHKHFTSCMNTQLLNLRSDWV